MLVILVCQAEGRLKVLGRRAEMLHVPAVRLVIPFGYRQRGHLGQDLLRIDGAEVFLGVAVAGQSDAVGIDRARQISGGLCCADADDAVIARRAFIADVYVAVARGYDIARIKTQRDVVIAGGVVIERVDAARGVVGAGGV